MALAQNLDQAVKNKKTQTETSPTNTGDKQTAWVQKAETKRQNSVQTPKVNAQPATIDTQTETFNRSSFNTDKEYEKYLYDNRIDTTKGDAKDYVLSKAQEQGIHPRQYIQGMWERSKNLADTNLVEDKYKKGELDENAVNDINNRYGVLLDENGNEADINKYNNDIELIGKTAEDLQKKIEKNKNDYTSGKIDYQTAQNENNRLIGLYNENAATAQNLQNYKFLQGFDYYDWAKENGKDTTDFEAYAENINDSTLERLGTLWKSSWADTIRTIPGNIDMALSVIDPNHEEWNLSREMRETAQQVRSYAFAGANQFQNVGLNVVGSLMPMINSYIVGFGLQQVAPDFINSLEVWNPFGENAKGVEAFADYAGGFQVANDTFRQRVEEGCDPVTAVINAALHGGITVGVEGWNAGELPKLVFGSGNAKYLSGMALIQKASPNLILSLIDAGRSEGREEVAETIADWAADGIQNLIWGGLSGQRVQATELNLKDMATEYAMAFAGAALLGSPNVVIGSINTKARYNATIEALKHFQSTVDSEIAMPEEKELAQKSIDAINVALKNSPISQSQLADAVELPGDQVAPMATYDKMMENLTNAMQPDVSDQFKHAQQTYQYAQQTKQSINSALAERGVNVPTEKFLSWTPQQQQNVIEVSDYANALNANVGFDDSFDGDGYYDPKTKQIMINPNSELGEVSTMIHELTHFNENSKFYKDMKKIVEDEYVKSKKSIKDAEDNIIKKYAEHGVDISKGDLANREFIAIETQGQIGNVDFVKKLIRYNQSLAYRLYKNIQAMTTSDVKTQLENTFMQAFRDAQMNAEGVITDKWDDGYYTYKNLTSLPDVEIKTYEPYVYTTLANLKDSIREEANTLFGGSFAENEITGERINITTFGINNSKQNFSGAYTALANVADLFKGARLVNRTEYVDQVKAPQKLGNKYGVYFNEFSDGENNYLVKITTEESKGNNDPSFEPKLHKIKALEVEKVENKKGSSYNESVPLTQNSSYDISMTQLLDDVNNSEWKNYLPRNVFEKLNSNEAKSYEGKDSLYKKLYSVGFNPKDISTDNRYNDLSKGMAEFLDGTKLTDDRGRPLILFHTSPVLFEEFDPTSSDHYRFGDKEVNYYSTDPDVSGSYTNGSYFQIRDSKSYANFENAQKKLSEVQRKLDEIDSNMQDYADEKYQEIYDVFSSKEFQKELRDTIGRIEDYEISEPATMESLSPRLLKDTLAQALRNINTNVDNGALASTRYEVLDEILLDVIGKNKLFSNNVPSYFADFLEPLYNSESISKLRDIASDLRKEVNRVYEERIKLNEEKREYLRYDASGKQYMGYGRSLNPYVLESQYDNTNWNTINNSDYRLSLEEYEQLAKDVLNVFDKPASLDYEDFAVEMNTKNRVNRAILKNVSDGTREYFVKNPIALANFSNVVLDAIRDNDKYSDFVDALRVYSHPENAEYGLLVEDVDNGNYAFDPPIETNDVVKAVLAANDFTDEKYDGVVFKNITDSGSFKAGDIRSDIVALFGSDQFKLMGNENPTRGRNILHSFGIKNGGDNYRATIAPYLDTQLTEENREELIGKAEAYYDAAAKDVADYLGIKLTPKSENIGGYKNDAGKKVRELSWTYNLGDVTPEQAKLFAAMMGDLAYENQEAVIAMRYLTEADGEHETGTTGEDGGTYGKEYGVKVKDIEAVENALRKANITDYNIDRINKYLTIQDFGFDENLKDKLEILFENGDIYETEIERNPIYSYYMGRENRRGIYEERLQSENGLQGGIESDNSGPVSEALRRVSSVIEDGTESPFLRRESGDLDLNEKDLKNYRTFSSVTDRQYNNDRNIDTATGVVKPSFIIDLESTVGRTTREAELKDGEEYAGMVAQQLDAGVDPEQILEEVKKNPLENPMIRSLYVGQVLADRGLYKEMYELAQWARDTDRLMGQAIESTKHLHDLDNSFARAVYVSSVQERLIDEYKVKYGKKAKIDIDQTINDLFQQYFDSVVNAKTRREFSQALGALVRKANAVMPKTIWDRITQYRMWSMLSGSKTAVGNFVSNVAALGLYKMNSFNQAIIESAVKEVNIKRVDETKTYKIDQSQRNATLNRDSKLSKKNQAIAKEVWKQMGEDVKSKYGEEVEKIPDIIKNNRKVIVKNENLLSPLAKGINTVTDIAQRIQNVMLNDAPVSRLAFIDKFDELAQVRGIDLTTVDKNSKTYNKLIDDAYAYAEEVVSHNATDISNTLSNIQKRSSTNVRINEDSWLEGVDRTIKKIKQKSNEGQIAYKVLDQVMMKLQKWFIPFYKTNASILQKGLQFSPLEWVQVANDYNKVAAGKMDLVDMVEHIAKATTGTELYLLGAIFGYLGLMKWKKDDEDYSGRLAIRIPGSDKGYTIDFIDPVSTIFAKGVVLAQELAEKGTPFKTIENLVRDYEDIFLSDELDMFSTMKDFFDTVGKVKKGEDDYGEYTISDGATDTAFSILNSYIPAIVRDVSRIIDPAKKVVYDSNNAKYLWNRLLNSTPFRTNLVDKKDATGNTLTYTQPFTNNSVFDSILTQMVSRGKLVDMEGKAIQGRTNESPLGEKAETFTQMAKDFQYNDTNGDGYSDTHWIRESVPANIYPGGNQVELNPEERDTYGKTWTETWTAGANSLYDNDVYNGLDYEKQADVVYELQAFSRECIEAQYCIDHNLEMTDAQKTSYNLRKFCTTDGQVDGYLLSLIALGNAKENKNATGGQQYVMGLKDENGKTIRNSRQLRMRQLYEEAGIYDEIVEAVHNGEFTYADFGLSKTVVEKYTKEQAKKEYSDVYKEVMDNTKSNTSGKKKSSSTSKKKSSKVSGGSSTKLKKAGKLNMISPAKQTIKTDSVKSNNFLKAYASTFNQKKPSTSSSGSTVCPKCGNKVSAGTERCPVCGTKLGG